ncbi:MAG: hypothetical protein WAS21_24875 [Geminicoccaceae bacterium]
MADQLAEEVPGLIEPLADLEEAEDYAESRVRELAHLQRIMTDEMRETGYDDVCRERLRIYRRLAWAVRMARRNQKLRPLRA